MIALLLLVSLSFSVSAQAPADFIVINELDSDTPGTDMLEFIELYDGGVGNTALDGLVLVAYNGANDLSYALSPFTAIDLDGYSTDANGYFLIGNAAVSGVDIVINNNTLQNGQDAVALYIGNATDFPVNTPVTTVNLVDAIVYDTDDPDDPGLLVLLNPGQPQVNESANGSSAADSISRCPNGQGGQRNTEGWVTGPPSPKAANPCDLPPSVVSTAPANSAVNVAANQSIAITFSEAVTVTGDWFTIVCTVSGAQTATFNGGSTTFVLIPDAAFTAGEDCTVTLLAAQIADQDGTPDNMAANFSFTFTIATGDICTGSFTPIYTLQENGANFGASGSFTVEGVVVGDYQFERELNGFYLQDPVGDGDPLTSDGIFVFDPAPLLADVRVGQRVRVTGTVSETFNQTQVNATSVVNCGDTAVVTPTEVTLPFTSAAFAERYEGMLITMSQTLTVTEVFNLGRFGEVVMSSGGRLINPTNIVEPGAPANAQQAANNLNRIILDDGLSIQNPDPTPYMFDEPTLRVGDSVTGLTGVLGYGFSAYRIQPVGDPTFVRANPRTSTPPNVGGTLRVASFNVLNYFNGDGMGGGFPTPRGANTPEEFDRQRAKIIEAIIAMNADIVGLIEIENDPSGATSAIQDLVNGLNNAAGAGTYALIDTGVLGTDAITVAFIYKPATVTPVGAFMTDPNSIFSRPPLAQTFSQNSTNQVFTAIVNHFKSKGCGGATGANLDQGDGQGCFNAQRVQQSQQLVAFINNVVIPTSGDPDVLIIGDLNSYLREDPIDVLVDAGFVHLNPDPQNYSYVFFGQSGSLDHALASASLVPQVTGAADWHINTDEPPVLDYNVEFKSPAQQALNQGTPFRSSDHDPQLIGLNLAPPNLIGNGTFDQPIGTNPNGNWAAFGAPNANSIVYAINGGKLEFYRQVDATQAVIFQNTGASLGLNAPLDLRFEAANLSMVRKRLTVLLHDNDFSDLLVCSFWLAPMQTAQTYQMRTYTTEAWTNASVSFYASSNDGQNGYQIDNVVLTSDGAANVGQTLCIDPNAPTPGVGADSGNLIVNGDFAAATIAPWFTWATPLLSDIQWQVSGGVFEFSRSLTAESALVAQYTNAAAPVNTPVEATFDIGNAGESRKRVTIIAHDADFSDLAVCTFWLPPNAPLGTYLMRAYVTDAWTNATFSVYASTPGAGVYRLDNVSVQARPTLVVVGVECYEPGVLTPPLTTRPDAPQIEPIVVPPVVVPYVPEGAPAEIPLLIQPAAEQETESSSAEGSVTE
jgi:predicted extracellular nuclease